MLNVGANNPNFKSNPIRNVNIHDSQGRLIKAVFSELNPKDDGEVVRALPELWGAKAQYIDILAHTFPKEQTACSSRYFALELLEDSLDMSKKIVGLLKLKNLSNTKNQLIGLQSRPDCISLSENSRSLCGVGENCLAGVFSLSKENEINQIELHSTNDGFYKKTFGDAKIDFQEANSFFKINKDFFGKYIDYIKQKYKIDK